MTNFKGMDSNLKPFLLDRTYRINWIKNPENPVDPV